jgi:Peptidase family M28
MAVAGWKQLIPAANLFRGQGRYPIEAYSEFMPPPRLGWKPYAPEPPDPQLFDPEDPWGWHITEFEEHNELQPGLAQVGCQVVGRIWHLLHGDHVHGPPKRILDDNLAWPPELAKHTGKIDHDRCVVLMPLALSRTQDDKGRVLWTLCGGSEQGPSKAFWKSFQIGPGTPGPENQGPDFLCHLLRTVYREQVQTVADLKKAGFRILPLGDAIEDFWDEGPLPEWTKPLQVGDSPSLAGVKYLLTFRPFSRLPGNVRQSYLKGKLHLLPTPASLIFWGSPHYLQLHRDLPLGLQVPLLYTIARHRAPHGLRVPQAGLLFVPNSHGSAPQLHHELLKNTYKRTHRWDKILRDQDELELLHREHSLLNVLFSSIPDDCGLYDKPMARNAQVWTMDGHLLLDGPPATPEELKHAMRTVQGGGMFGYRFHFPAMRVGTHAVYWHRPMVAYRCPDKEAPVLLSDAPLGYFTAYPTEVQRGAGRRGRDVEEGTRTRYRIGLDALKNPVELWPRLHQRPLLLATLPLCHETGRGPITARNVRKLVHAVTLRDHRPLSRSLARQLLTLAHDETLEQWLGSLPPSLVDGVKELIEPESKPWPRSRGAKVPDSWTYARTARRTFEVTYWKTIAALAEGKYLNKNNADCVRDANTQRELPCFDRQLDVLGDFLLDYYDKRIAAAKLKGKAFAASLPIWWRTDFDFSWMGGWLKNQERPAERDLVIVIPGKDRSRAVIMADHYDTAYMADRYEKQQGGRGARLSACGADDNHSATAALMLAAPIFLAMSQKGQLGCDVWLVHLTGEEFPADCLGARHLTQALVEGKLVVERTNGMKEDLSKVRIKGLYVSDMIAHNNDHERDVFQIAPGTSRASLWLAEQAQIATSIWNESVPVWNQRPERVGRPHGRRSPYGAALPEVAPHLALSGQVRLVMDPRSTLYNTDGQIFSDAGVPAVLFMENYDINRTGYHDTHDTMENIDLDYGAALAAIVIESLARAAMEGE